MTKEFKRTVELNSDHEIGGFDCGVPELDSWLRDRGYETSGIW